MGGAAKVAMGAIIGIIVGSVVCFLITVFIIVWCCCMQVVVVDGQSKRQCKYCCKPKPQIGAAQQVPQMQGGYPTAAYANTTMTTQPMMVA